MPQKYADGQWYVGIIKEKAIYSKKTVTVSRLALDKKRINAFLLWS